jgi:hypothetical protein
MFGSPAGFESPVALRTRLATGVPFRIKRLRKVFGRVPRILSAGVR